LTTFKFDHLQTQIRKETDLKGIPDLGAQERPEQAQVLAPLPRAATPLVGDDGQWRREGVVGVLNIAETRRARSDWESLEKLVSGAGDKGAPCPSVEDNKRRILVHNDESDWEWHLLSVLEFVKASFPAS
jgi:hypothetical protein